MLFYHCCCRDKELAKVVVRKEDVDLIVSLCYKKHLVIDRYMLEAQKLVDGLSIAPHMPTYIFIAL